MPTRCRYQQCQERASYTIEGDKQAVYCKLHAEDSMVNVNIRCCSQYGCSKRSNFNVKGKKPLYCKNHAVGGMVNVSYRRCSHDACSTHSSFNVKGSRTAKYCKQHAVDGMVNVVARRCSHDACSTQPSFNVEGSKTAKYCRQHAQDGMVNVIDRRCSHDTCSTQPSFNIKGTKMAKFCHTHAEDGMVNVVRKFCSRNSCTRRLRFKREDSKRTAYCSQHSEETMVNVRPKGPLHALRTTGAELRVPLKTEDTSFRQYSLDSAAVTPVLPDKEVDDRKRSRLNPDVDILPNSVDDYIFMEGKLSQHLAMGDDAEASLNSCHRAFPQHLDDGNVGPAPEHTAPGFRMAITPLPDTHQLREPIKTEIAVVASF